MKASLVETCDLVIEVFANSKESDTEIFAKTSKILAPEISKQDLEILKYRLSEFWLMGDRMEKWTPIQIVNLGLNTLHSPQILGIFRSIMEKHRNGSE